MRIAIEHAAPLLRRVTDAEASVPRAMGKWSPKEIIGHLIDSASNNHGRFVRAQLSENLRFTGYAQDEWVRIQGYAAVDWSTLVGLWERFNLHIAWVMERTPEKTLFAERADHNLQEVGFRTIPADQAATLDWFMRDYVEHLKHHMRQIDPALVKA